MNVPGIVAATVFAMLPASHALAQRIALPDAIAYPEGIAVTPDGKTAYVANSGDGTIARIDLRTGAAQVLPNRLKAEVARAVPGMLGIKLDPKGRLWIAGGRTGKIFVVDPKTGAPIATIDRQADTGTLNDIAFAGGRAWFTDTTSPVLWSVDLSGPLPKTATRWMGFEGTPLQYDDQRNLNGIVSLPDGSLLVGQMSKGLLFRIDTAARKVTPIDLGGELVVGADGIVLDGDMLHVVCQFSSEIATIRLAPDFASGKLVSRIKAPGLLLPATAAKVGKELIVVNGQFAHRAADDAERPFTLARVPLTALAP